MLPAFRSTLAVLALTLLGLGNAGAQSVLSGAENKGAEIEIEAEDGIEWIQDKAGDSGQYHARGNARAAQGGVEVFGDELIAFYKSGPQDQQQIYRMDAIGHVTVNSKDTKATGDKGVYHIDKQVMVLVGKDLQVINPKAVITAQDSLEFWEARSVAVARGKATVTQEDKRLRAEVLTAFIEPNKTTGKNEIERIDATGGVHISTPTEIIRGREGVYEVTRQMATLCGDVKITRGENQLNGECAEVNMKTGRSKLKGGTGKVKGLLMPSATDEQ